MNRIKTNNFILIQDVVESDGESTWSVKECNTGSMFYIHVFRNNQLNIKIFSHTRFISNPSEAIVALCNLLIDTTNIIPSINIIYTNKNLISICTKAGFKKKRNVKHLYIFKATHMKKRT